MTKGLKYVLIILAVTLLLPILVVFFTQTHFFKDRVTQQIVKLVEKNSSLRLEIDKLEGNFYDHLRFKNVRFTDEDSTVAVFSSVYMEYDLWELITNVILIDSLIIENPEINLWQMADSTWNVAGYFKPTNKANNKSNPSFDWPIHAKHLAVRNGTLSASSFSELIPQKMQSLNIVANGLYSTEEKQVSLQKVEFTTTKPDFVLNQLSGVCTLNSSGIQLDSVMLLSGGSSIDLSALYASEKNMNAFIDASRIDNKELAIFVPSVKLLCSPTVKANFKAVKDSVFLQAEIAHKKESVKADITLSSMNDLLARNAPVSYSAALNFNAFRLQNWIETNLAKTVIIGDVMVEGTNIFDQYSAATIRAKLNRSVYDAIVFNKLSFEGDYNNDSLNAVCNIVTNFGDIDVSGVLTDISDSLNYKAKVVGKNFDVSTFVPQLENAKVNGSINAEGRISDANQYLSDARLNLTSSTIYHIPISNLVANFKMDTSQVFLDSLLLNAPGVSLAGNGTFRIDSLLLNSKIYADVTSLESINEIVELPIAFDSARTVTDIRGPLNNLQIGGDVEIWNAKGYSVDLEKADAHYLVEVISDSINVKAKTQAYLVETGPIAWDTTSVAINYTQSAVNVDAFLNWRDTLTTAIAGNILVQDTMAFTVSKFEINSFLMNLYMPDTMQATLFEREKLELENFVFKDRIRDDFHFSANGVLTTNDSNKVDVLLNQLDLRALNKLINQPDSVKGMLSTELVLRGNADNPTIKGHATVKNPEYGSFHQSLLQTEFGFENQEGFANLSSGDFGNSFSASINAQFNAYLDSLLFVFHPPTSFEGLVIFDSVDVSKALAPFVPNDSLNGVLNGKVTANGDWKNPLFYGAIHFNDVHYVNNELGIDYDNIKTSVVFDGNKIALDTALFYQKKGVISLSGQVEFDSTIIAGNITSSSLQLEADHFFLTKHRNYEILLDANTFIKTQNKKPEFGGSIKVIRSDVFLPAIMARGKSEVEGDVPLLVEALQENVDSVVTEGPLITRNKAKNFSAYTDALTGRINVEIPRNTWIKSDDMRLELSGDVEIIKTGPFFEIFGNIDIVRGHYILYGRKLNLQESEIIFQGGQKVDPTLNIVAEYVYRDSEKEKRYLELLINGELSEPDITFLLDGSEITETDGISILVFGATSDEIGYSGQNGLIGSVGSNAVANVLTSQLSRTLGTQLKLDMIEITATESWQSAAFVVGKYITNDIFLIYQRGFGEVDGDEITPETITIEYELNDNLFLRLQSGSAKESGVDIILKFEKGDKIDAPFKRSEKKRNQKKLKDK